VHIFTEDAFLDRYALPGNQVSYFFVELFGQLGLGGSIEAGSATLSAVAVQGKIADEQNRTADIEQASVHLAVVILEDTQIYQLFSYKLSIFECVLFADTEINEQSFIDPAN
jgi:hypothetical protein